MVMEKPNLIHDFMQGDDDDMLGNFDREWAKVDANLKNEGYRLGQEEGYEQCLQKGFNTAFKEALTMSIAAGKLQGNLSAKMTLHSKFTHNADQALNKDLLELNPSTHDVTRLLSSCSNLIASIPSILKPEPAGLQHLEASEKFAATLVEPQEECLVQGSSESCLSAANVNNSSNCEDSKKGRSKHIASCFEVCNSSEHFWNHLENFKLQAAEVLKTQQH